MNRAELVDPDRPRDIDLATAVQEWKQSGKPLNIEKLSRVAHVRFAAARAYLERHGLIEGKEASDERAMVVAERIARDRASQAGISLSAKRRRLSCEEHGQASARTGITDDAEIQRRAKAIRAAKVEWVKEHGLDRGWLNQLEKLPLDQE
jgi:hypothetical protein